MTGDSKDVHAGTKWVPVVRCTLVGALALSACGGAEEAPLFDFVAELPFAEIHQETRIVDIGTIDGRFYLVDGWSGVDQPQGEANFAWGLGFESTLDFTVVDPREQRLTLHGRPYAPDGSQPRWLWTPEVNGHDLGEQVVATGDQELTVRIPASALRVGLNRLTVRYSLDPDGVDPFDGTRNDQSRAVAWDRVVFPNARRHGAVAAAEDGAALDLPVLARVDYFTVVPAGSILSIDEIESWGDAEELVLRVEIEPAGVGQPRRHFSRLPLTEPVAIPMPDSGESPVRISFLATSAATTGETGLTLIRPALRRGEAVGSGPPAGRSHTVSVKAAPQPTPGGRRTINRPPNVIVYLIDALRADHLGAYGYERPTSPRIDAFARDAIVFDEAIANSAWTRSAVASLFTGLAPRSHGVLGRDDALPADATTLAGLLRDAGYTTAAVATNGNISPGYGFDLGFDFWQQLPEQ